MRIGLRRLRAALAIFDDIVADEQQGKMKAELKWVTQHLGPARDLDVFATDVLRPQREAKPGDEKIAAALRDIEEKRAAAYARVAESLRSERFRTIVIDVVEWVETGPWSTDDDEKELRTRPIAELVKKELRRLRKTIKKRGADLRHKSVRQRHKLRIRAKRLRYGTEFFAGTFDGHTSEKRRSDSLSALKDLQDALGGLNDIATRQTLIGHGVEPGPPSSEEQAAKLLHNAEEAFSRFIDTKAFWKA
jgi:CHAD domain-containing protein